MAIRVDVSCGAVATRTLCLCPHVGCRAFCYERPAIRLLRGVGGGGGGSTRLAWLNSYIIIEMLRVTSEWSCA